MGPNLGKWTRGFNHDAIVSVLELVPEDEQIEQLRPAVYDGHGVGKQCADGSA